MHDEIGGSSQYWAKADRESLPGGTGDSGGLPGGGGEGGVFAYPGSGGPYSLLPPAHRPSRGRAWHSQEGHSGREKGGAADLFQQLMR